MDNTLHIVMFIVLAFIMAVILGVSYRPVKPEPPKPEKTPVEENVEDEDYLINHKDVSPKKLKYAGNPYMKEGFIGMSSTNEIYKPEDNTEGRV